MKIKRFQTGGEMAAPQGAEQPQGGGPEEQLMQMAQQIVQQLGPDAAGMLAQIIMEMLQSDASEPQGQPQFARQGGKLILKGRK